MIAAATAARRTLLVAYRPRFDPYNREAIRIARARARRARVHLGAQGIPSWRRARQGSVAHGAFARWRWSPRGHFAFRAGPLTPGEEGVRDLELIAKIHEAARSSPH
ncbi:MAG TPA: hypothetical protein VFZ21_04855 [Gemmatimonadaceae bacterium]|nr:hypothetical protein [Gemmatimonadaceae bacterium]